MMRAHAVMCLFVHLKKVLFSPYIIQTVIHICLVGINFISKFKLSNIMLYQTEGQRTLCKFLVN